MSRRVMWWTASIVFVLALLFALFAAFGPQRIVLSQAQIQEKVNAALPKSTKDITVTAATFVLADGKIDATFTMEGVWLRKYTLTAQTVGVPEYNPASGEFFFRPSKVKVREFAFEGERPQKLLEGAADRYITNPGARRALTDAAPLAEKWMTAAAERGAVIALTNIPVWKVGHDIKGTVLRATLDSVKVEADTIVVDFSLWRLTWWVGMALLFAVCAIAMVGVLIAFPELGLAIALAG